MLEKNTSTIAPQVQDILIACIEDLIDAEHSASTCYSHLAKLIKNGGIRKQFNSSAEMARTNRDMMMGYLKEWGVHDFVLEEMCTFCKLKPESFSISGAIDLCLQIDDTAIKHYKELIVMASEPEKKDWFRKQLKEKIRQKNLLKRERKFEHEEEPSLINTFCISYIASKLSE